MAGHRNRTRSDPGLTTTQEIGSTLDTASETHNVGAGATARNNLENEPVEEQVQEENEQVQELPKQRVRASDDSQATLRPVKKTRAPRQSNSSERTVIKAARRAKERVKSVVKRILGRHDPNVEPEPDAGPGPGQSQQQPPATSENGNLEN